MLLKDSFGWGAAAAGIIATVVGAIDIVVQGGLVGKLLSVFGEVKLGIGSLMIIAVSYVLISLIVFTHSPVFLVIGVILFAGAGGLMENSLRSLISRQVSSDQQGVVNSASQSIPSLALILGALYSGFLYVQLGHAVPYLSGALIMVLAIGSIVLALPSLHIEAAKTPKQ